MNEMIFSLQTAVERMGTQGVAAGDKIASQLERMFADGEARQQKMTSQMDAFVQQMQESVGRGQSETIDQVAKTVGKLELQMQTMVEGIGQTIARAQEDGMRNVTAASDGLAARVDGMFDTLDQGRKDMDQQAQQALQRFQAETKTVIDELGSQIRSLVDLVERERLAMRQTIDTLGGQTERSLQGMQVGADKMRSAAERFDVAGTNVHTALQSSADMVAALRASASEISVSMRDMSAVVADYRANREVTAQGTATLQSIVQTAQQEAGLREKAVNDLMRLSEQIHKLNHETEEFLEQISSVVGRTFEEFGDGIERTLLKTMGSLDAELDKAVKSLAGGVESVAENIEDLSDVLSKATLRTAKA